MKQFHKVTRGGARRKDHFGQGHFGAGRGGHSHQGVDLVADPDEEVYSPIDGEVIRETVPYADDPSFRGVLIRGTGQWAGIEVKLFYVQGYRLGVVKAGETIGRAQDLRLRYRGITNHVHLEVREFGCLLSPDEAYSACL